MGRNIKEDRLIALFNKLQSISNQRKDNDRQKANQNEQNNSASKENTNSTKAFSEMSASDALEVMGLSEHATDADIKNAYRILAGRLHPDRAGGSNYLMKMLNEARDVLLH
jgi:DnaJ-domain-containing protein 1